MRLPFAERASFVSQLRAGTASGGPEDCCFDLDGDGALDNKLGNLMRSTDSLSGASTDAAFAEAIATGRITLLLEAGNAASPVDAPSLELRAFRGLDASADPSLPPAGLGSFVVASDEFAAGSAVPLHGFAQASIAASRLTADPGELRLPFPFVGTWIEPPLIGARLTADVAVGPNGVGLQRDGPELDPDGQTYGAKLGGAIRSTDLFDAINQVIAACPCVVIAGGGPLISSDGQCQTADTTSGVDATCRDLPTYCSLTLSLLRPDLDTDGDGQLDALSAGFWLKATSATLTSVSGCN